MPTEPSLNSVNDLKVYFILKTNSVDECSQTIMRCLDCIRSLKISTQWISENECLKIQNFKKSDVFVIEEFDGSSFDHLSYHSSECLIISPSCIEYCLFENVPIPYNKYPVFSLAMEKLVITLSSTSRRNKDDAKKKVRCMCGYYSDNLLVSTTHLIVSKIMSEKYHKACESNIPVFTFNWINVVWNDSCTDFKIKATDTKYEKFKCPIFYNLNVTLTGLENTEQSECMEHINKNGGTCTDTIENNTDVLVMGIFIGDQFRCARNRGIPCVKTNWVYKSIEKGYAVRFDSHLVDDLEQYDTTQQAPNSSKQSGFKFVHSSPENGNHIDVLIANQNTTSYQSATKDKIVSLKPPPVACVTPQKKNRTRDKSYKQILNDISVGDIRQCGLILDGCKIYLSGFSPSEEDKLRRIINYGGATRFTELDESLTHIIVGNSNENFEDQINSMHNKPHVVRLEWLKDSIFKKYTLSEDQYNYFDNIRNNRSLTPLEEPSPLSKKGLQILTPKKVPINERVPSRTNVIADMHLLQEYSQPLPEDNFTTFENNNEVTGNKHVNVINNECTEDAVSNFSQKVADENVFKGLTFKVVNHDEGTTAKITEKIILYGGYVIERNKFTVPDYTVVPIANSSTSSRCGKLVTFIWLNDCISNKNIMPILYYHRSIAIPQWNHLPLRDCIITFSGYYPAEKKFIEHIAIALGAKCQETLSKKFNEKANALRNTHLVCRVPNGNKFKAAKKWSLPIVTKDWLMQCLNVGQRVAESDFALSAEPADDTKPEATGNEDKFNISEALRKTLSSSTKAAGQNVSNIQKEPLSDVRVNDVTATNKDQSNDRLPSPVTFRDINPKFHSTMKPLEQQLKKNPSETASSPLTTFANMNPKFHSTMKPIAEPKKKN